MTLRHFLATSDNPLAQLARRSVRAVNELSVPAPKLLALPLRHGVVATRELYYFGIRVFVCEPLFKTYCKEYGKNLHTGTYLHYITGRGDIILGDNVLFDGKIGIVFASRFAARPVLKVGNNTGFNHGCQIYVGKGLTVGNDCRISGNVTFFDTPGHPSDPERRKAGEPPRDEDVKPITIEDNVWIGRQAVIGPGITVGEGSIVSNNSVVMSDVPAYTIVAGNPARKIAVLTRPGAEDVVPVHRESK